MIEAARLAEVDSGLAPVTRDSSPLNSALAFAFHGRLLPRCQSSPYSCYFAIIVTRSMPVLVPLLGCRAYSDARLLPNDGAANLT